MLLSTTVASATPVVAVLGSLLILAVVGVMLTSFVLYRRSGRRWGSPSRRGVPDRGAAL